MRKSKIVDLGSDREVTVKELKNKHLYELLETVSGAGKDTRLETFRETVGRYLPRCVDGLDMDGLLELTPSETRLLLDAVMEVNSDFFALGQAVGLAEIMAGIKKILVPAILSDFLRLLDGSSQGATSTPGNTAGASAESPSTS